jgi:hypothetical protein
MAERANDPSALEALSSARRDGDALRTSRVLNAAPSLYSRRRTVWICRRRFNRRFRTPFGTIIADARR